jgi:nicotinamide-nucleotide adenylyltransferase
MALQMCDRVLILVGSSQEMGTERNPFDIQTRMQMIREIYPYDNVIIKPLADLSNENDITTDWGKYLIDNIEHHIYKKPDIMIYGNDESRSGWFDPDDIMDITEIIVPRNRIPISATQLREALLKNDKETWFRFHSPKLHKYFGRLREELLASKHYSNEFTRLIGLPINLGKTSNDRLLEDQEWD